MKSILPQKNHVEKSFVWSSAITVTAGLLASFLAFLFNCVVVKFISPALYGEYNTATSYASILATPLAVISLMIIQKVGAVPVNERLAAAKKLEKRLLFTLKKSWALWLGTLLALGLILFKFANFNQPVTIIYIILTLLTGIGTTFYGGITQARKFFIGSSLVTIVANVVKIIGGIALVPFLPTLTIIYLIIIICALTTVFGNRFIAWKKSKSLPIPKHMVLTPVHFSQMLLKKSFLVPFFAILTTTLLLNLDLIIVKIILPSEQVGIYSLLSLFAKIPLYAASPIVSTAYAFFTGAESKHQNLKVIFLTIGAFFAMGLVMFGLYTLFPAPLIKIVGSSDYLEIAPYLWLSAIFGTLYTTILLLSKYLVSKNSLWVAAPFLICLLQIAALLRFHDTLPTIMWINIFAGLGFIVVYLPPLLKLTKNKFYARH